MSPADPLLPPYSFDDVAIDPEAERKEKLGKAKLEVGAILDRLGKCCSPVGGTFQWPKRADLERLDDLILEIWLWIRPLHKRRNPRTVEPWRRYCAVDHCWPGLHLCRRIKRLLERARDNAPPRPLGILWQMPTERNLVSDFFGNTLPMTHKEPAKVASVDWEGFAPLFLYFKNEERKAVNKSCREVLETRLGDVPGSNRLVAYAAFLEIKSADQAWASRHASGSFALMDWVTYHLRNVELIRILKRLEVGSDRIPWLERIEREARQEVRRKAAAERKRRERARKQRIPRKECDSS
jgi:hypothetical protein